MSTKTCELRRIFLKNPYSIESLSTDQSKNTENSLETLITSLFPKWSESMIRKSTIPNLSNPRSSIPLYLFYMDLIDTVKAEHYEVLRKFLIFPRSLMDEVNPKDFFVDGDVQLINLNQKNRYDNICEKIVNRLPDLSIFHAMNKEVAFKWTLSTMRGIFAESLIAEDIKERKEIIERIKNFCSYQFYNTVASIFFSVIKPERYSESFFDSLYNGNTLFSSFLSLIRQNVKADIDSGVYADSDRFEFCVDDVSETILKSISTAYPWLMDEIRYQFEFKFSVGDTSSILSIIQNHFRIENLRKIKNLPQKITDDDIIRAMKTKEFKENAFFLKEPYLEDDLLPLVKQCKDSENPSWETTCDEFFNHDGEIAVKMAIEAYLLNDISAYSVFSFLHDTRNFGETDRLLPMKRIKEVFDNAIGVFDESKNILSMSFKDVREEVRKSYDNAVLKDMK